MEKFLPNFMIDLFFVHDNSTVWYPLLFYNEWNNKLPEIFILFCPSRRLAAAFFLYQLPRCMGDRVLLLLGDSRPLDMLDVLSGLDLAELRTTPFFTGDVLMFLVPFVVVNVRLLWGEDRERSLVISSFELNLWLLFFFEQIKDSLLEKSLFFWEFWVSFSGEHGAVVIGKCVIEFSFWYLFECCDTVEDCWELELWSLLEVEFFKLSDFVSLLILLR